MVANCKTEILGRYEKTLPWRYEQSLCPGSNSRSLPRDLDADPGRFGIPRTVT